MSKKFEDMTEEEINNLDGKEGLAYVTWALNKGARERGEDRIRVAAPQISKKMGGRRQSAYFARLLESRDRLRQVGPLATVIIRAAAQAKTGGNPRVLDEIIDQATVLLHLAQLTESPSK